MIKNLVCFEIKVEDRIYQFLCTNDSFLGEIHDVLHRMKDHVVERIKVIQEKEKEEKKDG